jgi:hypothetical protein
VAALVLPTLDGSAIWNRALGGIPLRFTPAFQRKAHGKLPSSAQLAAGCRRRIKNAPSMMAAIARTPVKIQGRG